EHAQLDRRDAEVTEAGIDLGTQEAKVRHLHRGDAAGVLGGQCRDGAQAMYAMGGEGLQVGLDAGAAAGIGSGDGQRAGGAEVVVDHEWHCLRSGGSGSYNGGMIAIREAWRAGLFKREHWAPNVSAGIIVGVVALPLAMAFAIASGVKPEQGLYTAIIAGAAVALFGGTRIQIAGPTGAFIVILAGVVAQFGVQGLLLATLMAGVMLVLMGLARFGAVIRYIPDPVIV